MARIDWHRVKRGAAVAALALAGSLMSACGGSDEAPPPPPAAVAPTITAQPASVTVTEGSAANFAVTATGTAPLAYQWHRNGVAIAGANAASYTLGAATLADSGSAFTVTVSNSAGSATSSPALLTVNAARIPVTITAQPQSMTVAELQTITLEVAVSGTAPFTYQWQRSADGVSWADVPGATAATYTTPQLLRTDSGVRYRVLVDNAANQPATSAAAQITVTPDAAVLLPAGGTVSGDNDNIRLTVPAGALLGPTRFTFTPLSSLPDLPPEYALIPGTVYSIVHEGPGVAPNVTVLLTLRAAAAQSVIAQRARAAADQRVVRMNEPVPINTSVRKCQGSPNSFIPQENDAFPIVLCENAPNSSPPRGETTVGAMRPVPEVLPRINQQPGSRSVPLGEPTAFAVVATGPSLNYQWRRNGTDIPGATGSTYSIASVTAADNGARFSVVVRNDYGSVTSAEATLTVGPPLLPIWTEAREIAPFATTSGYFPNVGGGAGPEFAVWSDGERLRGAGLAYAGSFAPVDTLDLPMRGARVEVVSGPNRRLSYVVFVDDDGTGNCGAFNGNRLSGVAVSSGSEGEFIPRSPRFTLYQSAGCIGTWEAGRVGAGLVFAVTDAGPSAEVRVGVAGVFFDITSTSPFAGSWVVPSISTTALPLSSACSGFVSVANQGLMGVGQSFERFGTTTEAVLAINAHDSNRVCTSVLTTSGSTSQWSTAQPLFNESCNDLATAIDGDGNALVVCNRGLSFNPPSFRMTAAYRPAGGGAWQMQQLDASANEALPHAAFDASGNAIVVWRTSGTAGAPTRVYAARRSVSGQWSTTTAITPAAVNGLAVDTRYPRISVLSNGEATAFFQLRIGGSDLFRVHAAQYRGGSWREPAVVQRDPTSEGRFAETQRSVPDGSFVGTWGPNTVWRETDPDDPARVRLVTARRTQ